MILRYVKKCGNCVDIFRTAKDFLTIKQQALTATSLKPLTFQLTFHTSH